MSKLIEEELIIDERKAMKMLYEIISEEKQNLKTDKLTNPEMVKKIKEIIEEGLK